MITVRVINIKDCPYYFFNSTTNIKIFYPNLLNINKTSFEKKILTLLFMKFNNLKILIVRIIFILFLIM